MICAHNCHRDYECPQPHGCYRATRLRTRSGGEWIEDGIPTQPMYIPPPEKKQPSMWKRFLSWLSL